MKVKFKLDKAALKDFFTHHSEKVVFSVVIVCFLLFVYSAVNGEVWTSKPKDLSDVAKAAVKRINDTPAEKGKRDVPNVYEMAVKATEPINPQWYPLLGPIFPLPHKQAVRERPDVLPLEKLQAIAGTGAFNMRPLMAGPMGSPMTGPTAGQSNTTHGQRWVVITGLLPFAKQRDAYVEALKGLNPQNPTNPIPGQTELPVWIYYYVERAEVTSGDQVVDSLQWTELHARRALFVLRRWQSMSPEIVPAPFLHTFGRFPMAFPLGPLVNATWGAEVAHEPEIPIFTRQDQMFGGGPGGPYGPGGPESMMMGPDGRPMPKGPKTAADKKAEKDKSAAQKALEDARKAAMDKLLQDESNVPNAPPAMDESMPTMPGAMPGMPGAMPGMPGMPDGMPGMYQQGAYPGGMMPPGMSPEAMMGSGSPYGMPGGAPGMVPGTMGMPGQMGELVQYQLFRFFDFTVEPAKRYRYRVRLELRNPNYKVDSQFLADEKEKTIETLKSEWSEPSEPVFVARDARVLAGPVNMPRDPLAEPWGTFGIVRFDMDSGETLFKEFPNDDISLTKMFRGQLANFRDIPKPVVRGPQMGSPGGSMPMMDMPGMPGMPGMPMPGGPGAPPGPDSGPATMDFLSDYVLLDMNGGTKLPGKAKLLEPGRMLWLDPAGKLIVRNDIDDEEEFDQFKESQAPPKPAGPGMPGMPGFGPEGGMMPPGMMPGSGMSPEQMMMMGPGGPGMELLGMPGAGKSKAGSKSRRRPRAE